MDIFTESKVKNDLKNLRSFDNIIKVFDTASKYFSNQYNTANKYGLFTDLERESMEKCLRFLDSNRIIKEQILIKEKYFNALSKLDIEIQSILVDAYINDKNYIKIAQEQYCSVETIKRRVKYGVNKLVEILNNEK